MASLSLRGIYKRYPGGVVAVSDFTMNIKDKEFIILVGPSGCGKSTTYCDGFPELRSVSSYDCFREHGIRLKAEKSA